MQELVSTQHSLQEHSQQRCDCPMGVKFVGTRLAAETLLQEAQRWCPQQTVHAGSHLTGASAQCAKDSYCAMCNILTGTTEAALHRKQNILLSQDLERILSDASRNITWQTPLYAQILQASS